MKRALAAFALLAILPSAYAQDKAKSEFTHDGEFRLRDTWDMNEAGDKNAKPSNMNTMTERFKLDLGFKATDKLSAHTTLLNNNTFGSDKKDGAIATPDGSKAPDDYLTVNQAYGNWIASDEVAIKFGRMNYQIGDGTLFALNDFEAVPYAFDGGIVNWEAEFGKFQFFAFKYKDLGLISATSATSDSERNAYGVNFDMKNMPEWMKMLNVHLLQDSGNAEPTSTFTAGKPMNNYDVGRNILRYGANANFMFSMIDLKLWYEGMGGKYHALSATNVKTDVTASGSMMQAEVGANFPAFMSSRLFFKWHQDSGQKDNTSTKNETYDAYFHEQHCSAGCMDILDWGNLTFMEIGLTGKPTDTTDVGLSYWMFSRTEKGAKTNAPIAGTDGNISGANLDKSALGNEFDLWAEHHYNSNLSTIARVSQFMPGDYYKANSGPKDTITQVYLEGKFTF